MTGTSANYLDFLESIYGKAAREQIVSLTGMDEADVTKAAEAFVPAFLGKMMENRSKAYAQSGAGMPSFASFWSDDMKEAMEAFMAQSAEAAKKFAPSSAPGADAASFPFASMMQQSGPMEQLFSAFMGQAGAGAQSKFFDDMAKASGVDAGQLRKLFPILTTYGLMPLMPPSMDDPAGWVDYLGTLGRQNFRRASREFDAMPNPANAAFEGLLSGFFPQADKPEAEPDPMEAAEAKMDELKDASLELQTNYIKGLNSLFESYSAGFKGDAEE